MITSPFDSFVASHKPVELYSASDGDSVLKWLLWGDGVKFLSEAPVNGRRKVRSRGTAGWVDEASLGGQSLLEYYFIDVGQGDSILIKTPDFRHILIDGGFPRAKQPTGKSAADFVDWKFVKDYGLPTVALDALIASHNDQDHYGGLADLLDAAQAPGLEAKKVTVEAAYHAGLSWWKNASDSRTLGTFKKVDGQSYLVDLLGDRASAEAALKADALQRLQGAWADFIKDLLKASTQNGNPTPLARLSHATNHVPGFEAGDVTIKVLAPVEYEVGGGPGLRALGGKTSGQNTNGHSVMLRVDYGRTRTLLTGDLNKAAQQLLLEAYAGKRLEFAADVAKACHHGSDDVSMTFLQAMSPSTTIISSGDAEGHDHPRPQIVAASGATGHLSIEDDEIVTPLVYSTETARSYSLGRLTNIELHEDKTLGGNELGQVKLYYEETKSGDIRPSKRSRKAAGTYLVSGLVYGLVNVRTDGQRIQTATLNEVDASWSVKNFESRF
jgi:beta-lactamase superfamily II metal-dependent hydrolase